MPVVLTGEFPQAVARVWESCFVQGAIASEVYLLAGLLRLQRRAIVTSSGTPAALESLVQLFNQLGGTVESASLLRMARVTREAFIQLPGAVQALQAVLPKQGISTPVR